MRKARLMVIAMIGAAMAQTSRSFSETSRSTHRLNSAVINVTQPVGRKQKQKPKRSLKPSVKYNSSKPIKSKSVSVFRNKSNI